MVTGGSAVGFWGHIRTTMDVDIVIQIQPQQISRFLQSIEKEAYVDIQEAQRAIANKEMFNGILYKTGFKIDIIPLDEDNPYEREKFNNRIKLAFHHRDLFVISPEDLFVSKLLWSKSAGGSERQLKDCASIYQLNSENINVDYIAQWVKALDLEEEFNTLNLKVDDL